MILIFTFFFFFYYLAFISSLKNETKENAIVTLLNHLPLLHRGNQECKILYISLVTKILSHSITNGQNLEESRQLLSYALIHPAFSHDDRRMLKNLYYNLLTSYYTNTTSTTTTSTNSQDDLSNGSPTKIGKTYSKSHNNVYHSNNNHNNNNTYQNYINGGNGSITANSFHQLTSNNYSFSDNEMYSASNNLINSWNTTSTSNNSQSNNINNNNGHGSSGSSVNGNGNIHCFGSNSLPSGITPAHMMMHGIGLNGNGINGRLSNDLMGNINGNGNSNCDNFLFINNGQLMNNLSRLRRSNSLTPTATGATTTTNGLSINTNGYINENNLKLNNFGLPKSSCYHAAGLGAHGLIKNFHYHRNDNNKINGIHINETISRKQIAQHEQHESLHDGIHNGLSPQHSIGSGASSSSGSSGSSSSVHESHDDKKCLFDVPGSGMKDVPFWLKKKRLHKYTSMFSNFTYEQMIQLTDEELVKLNVTKGARNKILTEIKLLIDRPKIIMSLEKELNDDGMKCVRQVLNQIMELLLTPMKLYVDDGSQDNLIEFNENSDDDFCNCNYRQNDKDKVACDKLMNVPNDNVPGLIIRLISKGKILKKHFFKLLNTFFSL